MKSNPSEMNMEITEVDLSETEWKNRFLAIVEEARSENVRLFDKNYLRNFIMNTHQENVDADDVDDKNERLFNRSEHIDPKKEKIIIARRKKLMSQMSHIFDTQPRFKQICKHYRNKFVSSGFTTYVFRNTQDEKKYNHPVHELHEESNDLKYIIDLCGFKLTCLDATRHCFSQVMPLINNNCPNLRQLQLAFKEINSEDFVNAFSNMLSLRGLVIKWSCKTPLPTTLIRSLEQIGGTLTYLFLRNNCMQNDIFLPESSALADNFIRANAQNKLQVIAEQMKFLHQQAQRVLSDAKEHAILHHAACNFVKHPGNIYHLYEKSSGQCYFSMLSPEEWGNNGPSQLYKGSYRLEHDNSWTPLSHIQKKDTELNMFDKHLSHNQLFALSSSELMSVDL
ncbi:hypothetical protein HCN44_003757 [Aphidius gifuensis]|uniref:Uncharacterized protein n=1 Tax=Aphidius gifuensis TaxID=684658 RepID=A0A834XM95_APHGI|nr:hypothetical protein HCN44_003757 [Aphidius gifuensis]